MKLSEDGKTLLKVDNSDIKRDGSYDIPQGVTSIGSRAFYSCNQLQSITIPEGVTSIGNEAFYLCMELRSITIPKGVTSIGNWAFHQCMHLRTLTIPEGLRSIGFRAFSHCDSLQSITIPKGLDFIGEAAFFECKKLHSIMIAGADTDTEIQSVARLLPNDLKSNVVSREMAEAIAQVRKAQLSRVAQAPQINPLYRYFSPGSEYVFMFTENEAGGNLDKERSKLPNDIFRYMNPYILSQNPYYQKAKNRILSAPFPENQEKIKDYENTLKNIADESIQKAKEFSQPPVKLQRENQSDGNIGLDHLAMITPFFSPFIALAAIVHKHVTGNRFAFFQAAAQAQTKNALEDLRDEASEGSVAKIN
ncbi:MULTISPECIES: leucine-rich repeat domain-containing protein [unclassified Legionella]|uniref:leucine-rich repeat domain-containing protein n=1 Tax=unclassified Legionella TaxID=2622702 RepID=UPI001056442A|nr:MULTISPECIES: leucine-rich repeat domain-containing protein [unclassified Legionella]MDI9818172.1 leucine-rich repeat domain-containing protein [Legionella sp. PL877]